MKMKPNQTFFRETYLNLTLFLIGCQGPVAQWLATCAQKPKIPGSSLTASYAER